MGLDFVEVLMEIEDRFDIDLMSRSEWYPLHTAGNLGDLVWQRLQGSEPAIERADYQQAIGVVEGVFTESGVQKKWFSRDLNRWFPDAGRERIWQTLSHRLDCPLPELEHDGGVLVPTVPRVCSTKHDLVMWVLWNKPGRKLWRPVTPSPRRKPLGWPFPSRSQERPTKPPRSWTREEVWEEVRQILIEQLGLRPDEVVRDARLAEDIKFD